MNFVFSFLSNCFFVTVLGLVYLSGCATPPVAADAQGSKTINGIMMTCKKPFPLTQDCSIWNGAKRKIRIDGKEIKIAASTEGKIILVMDPHPFSNSLEGGDSVDENNSAFSTIKLYLTEKGIMIEKVTPIVSLGDLLGYVLELDGDGYEVLKIQTIKQ